MNVLMIASTALCLAQSLIDKEGFDLADQINKYLRWYHEGYLSVNGRYFDIGTPPMKH